MNPPDDLRRTAIKRPDENNHPTLDDEVLNEEMPVGDPRRPERPGSEEFPGKDDEPEPIPPPDEARG